MMPEKLKPCPFCGGEARIIEATSYEICVQCSDCYYRIGPYGTKEQATADWNRYAHKLKAGEKG